MRLGFLSTASIGTTVLEASRHAGIEVVAVGSRDIGRARAFVAAAGVEATAHGSYEALLADRRVEAVYVALPNALHPTWARRALDAGKHVLVEKPMAASAASARELFAVARGRGITLMEHMTFDHLAQTAALRSLLRRGAIGDVDRVEVVLTYPLPDGAVDIRLDGSLGGGALRDLGPYCLAALTLAGARATVLRVEQDRRGTVDVATRASLRLDTNATALLTVSIAMAAQQRLVLAGSAGSLHATHAFRPDGGARVVLTTAGGLSEDLATPHHVDAHVLGLREFAATVAGERAREPAEARAIARASMLECVERAAGAA